MNITTGYKTVNYIDLGTKLYYNILDNKTINLDSKTLKGKNTMLKKVITNKLPIIAAARFFAAAMFVAAAMFFAALLRIFAPAAVYADTGCALDAAEQQISVGDEFSVTASFKADGSIGTVRAQLSYSEDDIEFIASDFASGGGGLINLQGFPGSDTDKMEIELTFKALRQGSSSITLANGSIMSMDGISLGGSLSASTEVNVTAAADPDDPTDSSYAVPQASKAQLSSLTIPYGELKPAFSSGIYDYTVTVGADVTYFEPEGVTQSETDSIWYEGRTFLSDGHNEITITVTSADGTLSNVYTIDVYREPSSVPDDSEDESTQPQETQPVGGTDTDTSISAQSSQDSGAQQAAAVTQASSGDKVSSSSNNKKDGEDDFRTRIYALMAVILLAAVFVFFLIKNKSKNKNIFS